MTLKIAIVGCGKIADGHIEEIQKMPERARVVAVCDLELLMAEQIAVRYGIPSHYDSFDRMLDVEKPDVVHITTPPQSHLFLARRAIEAGAHVYVEKPTALNLADVRRLIELCTAAGKKMTVGWEYQFDPPAVEMRRLVGEGVLGDPVHVESCFGYNLAGPFGTALLGDGSHWVHRLPGKLFHNNIDHLLNKVVEFVDDEQPKVTATAYALREKRFGDARDDMLDELRVTVQGARVSAYGTFSSHARPPGHFLRVYGTKNTLHVDFTSRTVTLDASPKLPSAIGRVVPAFDQALSYLREGGKNVVRFARSDFHFFSGMNRLIGLFYDSITRGAELPISYRDMIRVAWMMDEIFRQVPQEKART
ncbi:Gfo/Idh/MocA family oxidoreductase [Sorangium sp. So ce375]|uniref:Gfo/Idh/MocA family protein n=1 Tax=Sorangium sp. So ce375 TaxID=3133306 RepID=UPI003F5C6CEB